jgi:hypothetical protein
MNYNATRHLEPVTQARSRGQRRIITYSPKLARRVQLHSYAAQRLWLTLETDPNIVRFCERPVRIVNATSERIADFWTCSASEEAYLCIGDPPSVAQELTNGVALRYVPLAQLAAEEVWTRNWQRMLPVMTAHKDHALAELDSAIVAFTRRPRALMDIERALATGEPSGLRARVFRLVHTGQLSAPMLRTQALCALTEFQATARHEATA